MLMLYKYKMADILLNKMYLYPYRTPDITIIIIECVEV